MSVLVEMRIAHICFFISIPLVLVNGNGDHHVDPVLPCPVYGWNVNTGNVNGRLIISYSNINSWNTCAHLCADNASCKYWTWTEANFPRGGGLHFWLFSQMDTLRRTALLVSGNSTCT